MTGAEFIPRWASPPGDTIKDVLREQHLDRRVLAKTLELSDADLDALLRGVTPLTINLADRLSFTIGGSVEFWMTRDGQYQADRSRVDADAWVRQMPVHDMSAFGWIDSEVDDWVEQIDECLHFFNVGSVDAWKAHQEALLERTRFRSSQVLETDEFAVAAWLRQCEVELSRVSCRDWDREAFAALLPQLLPLTLIGDPQRFLPELQ
ncbi:MAG: plasmid maintenance system antidote protein, partial [Actinobacteria bacterium]|nr:plasmid maintenance system antidote protein [Actinomycetota bacterium]